MFFQNAKNFEIALFAKVTVQKSPSENLQCFGLSFVKKKPAAEKNLGVSFCSLFVLFFGSLLLVALGVACSIRLACKSPNLSSTSNTIIDTARCDLCTLIIYRGLRKQGSRKAQAGMCFQTKEKWNFCEGQCSSATAQCALRLQAMHN